MQKKFKEKYNEGCIKIFTLLRLLYEDKADYEAVMKIFTENDEDKQHVILNKYLNTLKVFGVKVIKSNNKFILQNNPFGERFGIDDIKSVQILNNFTNLLPKGKTKNTLDKFIKTVEARFDDKANEIYAAINSTSNADFSFYYSDTREQIEKCEKFCQEDYKVSIKYLSRGNTICAICNAKQVIYDNKNAYIQIYKINEGELAQILIPNIISIEQIPSQKNPIEMPYSVTYKIKGRLAKAYNLKENEYLQDTLADGSKIIMNKNEPPEVLLKRLMRYSNECTIISPKNLKTRMIEMINDTLKNYE